MALFASSTVAPLGAPAFAGAATNNSQVLENSGPIQSGGSIEIVVF